MAALKVIGLYEANKIVIVKLSHLFKITAPLKLFRVKKKLNTAGNVRTICLTISLLVLLRLRNHLKTNKTSMKRSKK